MTRAVKLQLAIFAILIAGAFCVSSRFALAQESWKRKQIYDEKADARLELKEALAKAKAGHKRVIVVFGANWCFDCHVLDDAFHSPELAPIIAGNYVVVHVDIGKGEKNQDLMNKYEVPLKRGIPGLAVLGADGKLIYSQKNGEFENARAMSKDDFRDFLNKWRPETKND